MGEIYKTLCAFVPTTTRKSVLYATSGIATVILAAVQYFAPQKPFTFGGGGMSFTVDEWWFWVLLASLFLALLVTLHEVRQERDELRGNRDYRAAINGLSALFDEGNNKVLNDPLVKTEMDYSGWHERWIQWHKKVLEYLDENFDGHEKCIFKNLVTVENKLEGGVNADHNHARNMLVKELETLRGIIIRNSQEANKWRAKMRTK